MNSASKLGWTLAIAAMAAVGAAPATQAFENHVNPSHGGYSQNRGGGFGMQRGNAITGVWRLEDRGVDGRDRGAWSGPMASAPRANAARLPDVISIERDRGQFRIEARNGAVLRTADARHAWSAGGLRMHTTTARGAAIDEYYSLDDNGRRLIVRTTVSGPNRTRQITSVYQRA